MYDDVVSTGETRVGVSVTVAGEEEGTTLGTGVTGEEGVGVVVVAVVVVVVVGVGVRVEVGVVTEGSWTVGCSSDLRGRLYDIVLDSRARVPVLLPANSAHLSSSGSRWSSLTKQL